MAARFSLLCSIVLTLAQPTLCLALDQPGPSEAGTPGRGEPLTLVRGETCRVRGVGELKAALERANRVKLPATLLLENGSYVLDVAALEIHCPGLVIRSALGDRDGVILRGPDEGTNALVRNVFLVSANDVVIADLTLGYCRHHGVQIRGEEPFNVSGLRVHNCRIVNCNEQFIKGSSSESDPVGATDGCIEHCLFEFTRGWAYQFYTGGIDIHKGVNWVVRNNFFRGIRVPEGQPGIAEHAIHFWKRCPTRPQNILVEGNWVVNCDRGIGFGLSNAEGGHQGGTSTIRNNTVFNDGTGPHTDVGIGLECATGVRVENNTVVIQKYWAPIEYRFAGSSNLVFEKNLVNRPIQRRDGAPPAATIHNLEHVEAAWFRHLAAGDLRLTTAAEPGIGAVQAHPRAQGLLRVNPDNPRYFTDTSGRAIYLTGSHTWANLQDIGLTSPPPSFDFDAYLDFLERHHHNFIRLWRWEFPRWTERKEQRPLYCSPQPWARTGPGEALDGQPKFDLNQFDDAYFRRLRSRVQAAGRRGIYVSVMLFEGWGLRFVPEGAKDHPFHPANNVNQIGGELKDFKGIDLFSLAERPRVAGYHRAYVRKVIDTVNDLDNVLYEIANESDFTTTDWQYAMIRFIKEYEATQPRQHAVGMTSIGYGVDDLDRLLKSPADWISPNPDRFDYKNNPPAADGAKVILLDTDHLWGVGGTVPWVWKSFLRGLNPIWMDPYDSGSVWEPTPANAEAVRRALGDARRLAERINLAAMKPRPELASTGYCLANPGVEYLVYQPKPGEPIVVELKPGGYHSEWFDGENGAAAESARVLAVGGKQEFEAPFAGEALLYLKAL